MYTLLNGEFIPAEKAFLHVSDLSVQRGYGIFDFLKIVDNYPLFLEDYITRFYASACEMRLAVPYTKEEFISLLFVLVQKNNMPMSGIKIVLTGGYSPDAYKLVKPNLIITQQELKFPSDQISNGIKVISHEYVREMPHVKTINYIMGIWTQKKMIEQGAADVLYHTNSTVTEFPRCNFFLVKKDNTVVTPSKNILHGVTRKHVLELAARKYSFVEGPVTLSDIADASEAFLTSTTKRIIPITQVDRQLIGTGVTGPVTKELYNDLLQLELSERTKVRTKK